MNKQELIDKLASLVGSMEDFKGITDFHDGKYAGLEQALELIKKLDEPQKVKARLAKHWDEDLGDCLWWNFPVEEPPYCGTPLDDDFPKYKTHFTELYIPDEVEKEPLYRVKLDEGYFVEYQGRGALIIPDDNKEIKIFDSKSDAECTAQTIGGTVEEVGEG
ncbi:hypothetical protein [Enterococcus faecalis]|uniref:hypothetical protein n=1 Tax=Enterococcus faecalis TaxID=1351 RepID=UPI0010C20B9B|nr:hypothetical protein [Enterococcus faecalis]EGO8952416.1 hypothetical protein [Enterococcus faecalis]EJZ8474989.1 hypothetical protein [Enterococcus faecalis]ELZ4691769.1 hypothetical protein [Enterococcus faecalis]MDT2110104.1 hypothetical protein [Enterococcus faecalis]TKN05921.1 hypothetical protein DVW77_00900 [Enterococcus faecalis]